MLVPSIGLQISILLFLYLWLPSSYSFKSQLEKNQQAH